MKCPKCNNELKFAKMYDVQKQKLGVKCVKCAAPIGTWPKILGE